MTGSKSDFGDFLLMLLGNCHVIMDKGTDFLNETALNVLELVLRES
jgi:hypothetical protein